MIRNLGVRLKIYYFDITKAIELLAASIEIGTGLHKFYKYLKTHPVDIPSFIYKVDHKWYDKLGGVSIFYSGKTTTIFRIFKIQKEDEIIICSSVPKNLENARSIMVFVFAMFFAFINLPMDNSLIIPAMEGITTVTGLVFAVDALLITRYYSDTKDPVQKIRADFYVLALAFASSFIGVAYLALLDDAPLLAIKIALAVFNISYLIAIVFVVHSLYFLDLSKLLSNRKSKS